MSNQQREQFSSRLGFIFMAAGCAIGLGNVWRFPYVAGQYGGGWFVLLYLIFLLVLGFPVLMMELALGRGGRSTYPGAFRNLSQSKKSFWHYPAYILFSGNLILLMFYTVITGWLGYYFSCYFKGIKESLTPEFFTSFIGNAPIQIFYTYIMIFLTLAVCIGGLKGSIEKSVKYMMAGLLVILFGLLIYSLTLPNAIKGVSFLLKPELKTLSQNGIFPTIHAAMSQAFFTLSLGIGSIAICGSYFSKERSLTQEGVWIITFDTMVAILSGLIIFPCCASFGVKPDAGPTLIFITLTKVFANMEFGNICGALFFLFLTVAAFSTLVAVFENLVAFGMDEFKWKRKNSCFFFGFLLLIFSLPCILGFNLWKKFQPLGKGTNVLDLEDFIVSDNFLPLGALLIITFCTRNKGWGIDNFYNELNTGKGWNFPKFVKVYIKWILPAIVFALWVIGIIKKFF